MKKMGWANGLNALILTEEDDTLNNNTPDYKRNALNATQSNTP